MKIPTSSNPNCRQILATRSTLDLTGTKRIWQRIIHEIECEDLTGAPESNISRIFHEDKSDLEITRQYDAVIREQQTGELLDSVFLKYLAIEKRDESSDCVYPNLLLDFEPEDGKSNEPLDRAYYNMTDQQLRITPAILGGAWLGVATVTFSGAAICAGAEIWAMMAACFVASTIATVIGILSFGGSLHAK
ncbi:MAG: hypothetical protein PVH19_05170 [Planctomycetia bacterium]|jgi:hypothetical protein